MSERRTSRDVMLHTPEGVMDYLPDECMAKKEVERQLADTFCRYGYRRIETPTIEYHDIYSACSGDIASEKLFKFFDAEGHILALRGDITTSIARVIGTKWGSAPLPARLSYVGEAFRYNGSASSLPSEFTQAGIELIGQQGAAADAEIVMTAISALLRTGLDEFQIDIGQVDYFKGLVEQIGLGEEETEKIRILIDHKDSLGMSELLESYPIDEEVKGLLCDMPDLFGSAEVLSQADSPRLNARSKAALANLREVYRILRECGLEKYISIDLGMLQSIDYYTGAIFKGFTYGVGFAVCGGGRYDTLIGNFGADMPAVGLAISVNRVLSALQRQNKPVPHDTSADAVIYLSAPSAAAYQTGEKLRSAGLVIENYLEPHASFDDAVAYAKSRGIHAVLLPLLGGGVSVYYSDGSKRLITDSDIKEGMKL